MCQQLFCIVPTGDRDDFDICYVVISGQDHWGRNKKNMWPSMYTSFEKSEQIENKIVKRKRRLRMKELKQGRK